MKCNNCEYATTWSGPYNNICAPACKHPESGQRSVNLLDEICRCPLSGRVPEFDPDDEEFYHTH